MKNFAGIAGTTADADQNAKATALMLYINAKAAAQHINITEITSTETPR